jgi:hypothetical protein
MSERFLDIYRQSDPDLNAEKLRIRIRTSDFLRRAFRMRDAAPAVIQLTSPGRII